MPKSEAIKRKLTDIFIQQGLISTTEELKPDLSLIDDAGLDSFGFISLVMTLNTTFTTDIKSHEIVPGNFSTVEKLERFIALKTSMSY